MRVNITLRQLSGGSGGEWRPHVANSPNYRIKHGGKRKVINTESSKVVVFHSRSFFEITTLPDRTNACVVIGRFRMRLSGATAFRFFFRKHRIRFSNGL